jgi:enamine deaminase RidA (YjgF/YER057c/UK114 family)
MSTLRTIIAAIAFMAAAQPALADDDPDVEFLNSGKVVPATLPFSEAVRVDDTLYLSGQIGIEPGTMKVVPGGIREEARQALTNIKASLEAHGYAMRDVVKCTSPNGRPSTRSTRPSSPRPTPRAAPSARAGSRSGHASRSSASPRGDPTPAPRRYCGFCGKPSLIS